MRRFRQWVKKAALNPWLPIRFALAIGPMAMYAPHAEKWLVPYLLTSIGVLMAALFSIIVLACFFQGQAEK